MSMQEELDKLDAYFDEVRRRWEKNAEQTISRDFFCLWQKVWQPRPWAVADDDDIVLQGTTLDLVQDTERVAYVTWDAEAMCPVLTVEGQGVMQRILLLVQDGEPVMEEQDPTFVDDADVSHGERLEVIFDIIDHCRRTSPGLDIRTLRGRAFADALAAVADHHPPHVIRLMRRMRKESRERLLHRALAEFAVDELSAQLELPLGGSFAPEQKGGGENASPPAAAPAAAGGCPAAPLAGAGFGQRTPWDVSLDLELLASCIESRLEQWRNVLLHLAAAETIREFDDGDRIVKVPFSEEDDFFAEGSRLMVIRHGNTTPIGELRVDLKDRGCLYGRLRWRDPGMPYPFDDYLHAAPRPGPERYILRALMALREEVDLHPELATDVVRMVLGIDPGSLTIPTDHRAPAFLDASQARCFSAAMNENNPLILIQGPPGTGKTRVLECVVRSLCEQGRRVLITAPSNTAVDAMCRRLLDVPLLRTGYSPAAVARDVCEACWYADENVLARVGEARRATGAIVVAGTHTGIMRSDIVRTLEEECGPFDTIVFDEAGMARAEEMLLCMTLAQRAICFGDPMQLPPLPLEDVVLRETRRKVGPRLPSQRRLITHSALQWMTETRGFPMLLLTQSYRCQNPRLMRFASTLFYDARVKASEQAEYFALPFQERQRRFPPGSLRLFSTSGLPLSLRGEKMVVDGKRPGLENPLEAVLVADLIGRLLQRYPPEEIAVITPYRRQVRLLRALLTTPEIRTRIASDDIDDESWSHFLAVRISTVDSFQGGESDAVIISYVRSNAGRGIGFIADPNRVNVTHTRARREMLVVADIRCLVEQCSSDLFRRLVRAFERDGEIVEVTRAMVEELPDPTRLLSAEETLLAYSGSSQPSR